MEALEETTLEGHEVCCRGDEITPATRFEIIATTPFQVETSCRILVRTGVFVTSYLAKLRVEHMSTQIKMICRFCQEARSTEHVERMDLQSPYQDFPSAHRTSVENVSVLVSFLPTMNALH